uniref:Uncharacterized protein n=1 Tax=Clastoptera arizonana TaxID=38151 RepID=A0A1B6CRW9_9HEMI
MMRAASVSREIKVFFANIQGICAFFSTSPQRTAVLDDIVKNRLPRAVATRWNFQSRSVMTIFEHREAIFECMESLINDTAIHNESTICQASGHLKILTDNYFMYWLSFFSKVMPFIDIMFGQSRQ